MRHAIKGASVALVTVIALACLALLEGCSRKGSSARPTLDSLTCDGRQLACPILLLASVALLLQTLCFRCSRSLDPLIGQSSSLSGYDSLAISFSAGESVAQILICLAATGHLLTLVLQQRGNDCRTAPSHLNAAAAVALSLESGFLLTSVTAFALIESLKDWRLLCIVMTTPPVLLLLSTQ